MDSARIAELLHPYTESAPVPSLLGHLQRYLDLLLRWNARMNLTAVRDPEQIVTRHFGESLFAARVMLRHSQAEQAFRPASDGRSDAKALHPCNGRVKTLVDVGSGAGFPGIPVKLFAPELALTLIESQNKKATFLREVTRTLALDNAEVFAGRAEQWGKTADLVTLRAVEQFERALPAAAKLVAAGGELCLLIGTEQISTAQEILGAAWTWQEPQLVPQSSGRVVLVANAGISNTSDVHYTS